jgi:hypothetical protein
MVGMRSAVRNDFKVSATAFYRRPQSSYTPTSALTRNGTRAATARSQAFAGEGLVLRFSAGAEIG